MLIRYTECRLASAAEDMLLDDLDADTVDFSPTFDASQVDRVNTHSSCLWRLPIWLAANPAGRQFRPYVA